MTVWATFDDIHLGSIQKEINNKSKRLKQQKLKAVVGWNEVLESKLSIFMSR